MKLGFTLDPEDADEDGELDRAGRMEPAVAIVLEFRPRLEVGDGDGQCAGADDFLELGELMCQDALQRWESCGGHFREEMQTEDGEAKRDDVNFSFVAAWEYKSDSNWELHKEALEFEVVHPTQRSYK